MQKTSEIKTIWHDIEQSEQKTLDTKKFSKEEIAYLEWVRTRDNDKILQSITWKE